MIFDNKKQPMGSHGIVSNLGISSTPRNISRLWLKRPERNEVSIDATVLYNPMNMTYPLGNVYITNWKITIFKFGKSTISMGHGFNRKL
jgi:hypothetical protein